MTAKELCIILERYPADMRVVVEGYEGGYDDVLKDKIREINLELNVNDPDGYVGIHDEEGHGDCFDDNIPKKCRALLIGRVS